MEEDIYLEDLHPPLLKNYSVDKESLLLDAINYSDQGPSSEINSSMENFYRRATTLTQEEVNSISEPHHACSGEQFVECFLTSQPEVLLLLVASRYLTEFHIHMT